MFAVTSLQFVGQNLHFAIYLFAALACFAAGWLYFDAWTERRTRIDFPKWSGFFLLAIGFLVQGAVWESGWLDAIGNGIKLLGYLGLIIGNVLEPIQPRPKHTDATPSYAAPSRAPQNPQHPRPAAAATTVKTGPHSPRQPRTTLALTPEPGSASCAAAARCAAPAQPGPTRRQPPPALRPNPPPRSCSPPRRD
jgi:hypothetical protein